MARRLKAGFYKTPVDGNTWTVPDRYQDLQHISSGGYGLVCSAIDTVTNTQVAIKKLPSPFTYGHLIAKRTYREVKILQHMKHDNCLGLLDVFTPAESVDDFSDVYIVTDLMSTDLDQLLKAQRESHSRILQEEHIKFIIYQLLCGLKYLHSTGVVHRDIKPSNIGINHTCDIKILDFGLARSMDEDMTGYVATRYWRAPEIMLNWRSYNTKVDMWSVGCILAELYTGKPLFTGKDHLEHLHKIFNIIGSPSHEMVSKIPSVPTQSYLSELSDHISSQNLERTLNIKNKDALDLLHHLLTLDPDERYSAEQALNHRYFRDVSEPDYEYTGYTYEDDCEDLVLEASGWRHLVWKNISNYKAL